MAYPRPACLFGLIRLRKLVIQPATDNVSDQSEKIPRRPTDEDVAIGETGARSCWQPLSSFFGTVRYVKTDSLFKTVITFESAIRPECAVHQKPLGAQGISHNIVPVNLSYQSSRKLI
jgi:hypothetical protein